MYETRVTSRSTILRLRRQALRDHRHIQETVVLLIRCPWCGPRDEIEFRYGGQAHVAYPADPSALTDERWADYLFMRDNPKGLFRERWVHAAGCRRWFNAVRDTASHALVATYRPDEEPPA